MYMWVFALFFAWVSGAFAMQVAMHLIDGRWEFWMLASLMVASAAAGGMAVLDSFSAYRRFTRESK